MISSRIGTDDGPEVDHRDVTDPAVTALLEALDLRPGPDPDSFEAISLPQPWGRVFGGQLLAQGLLAAGRTLATGPGEARTGESRPVHSVHAHFPGPAACDLPLRFTVTRLRDGRSFSSRQVTAHQQGRPCLSMTVSFQVPAPGLEHQDPMPQVPGPEALPTLRQRYGGTDHPAAAYWVFPRPVDLRHVEGPVFFEAHEGRAAEQAVWLRTAAPLPDDPALHAAALAFCSDYTVLEPVLRRHGRTWSDPGARFASLDHAMWWHRPARADEWLLFAQRSPSASGARGLGTAHLFTRDGALVATVVQEGMIRVPE